MSVNPLSRRWLLKGGAVGAGGLLGVLGLRGADASAAASSLPASTKTGPYTLRSVDADTVVQFNTASDVVCTVPAGLPVGMVCEVFQLGAGPVRFAGSGGVVLESEDNLTRTRARFATVALRMRTSSRCALVGGLA